MKLIVTEEDCKVFPGGWSVWPDEMYQALNEVEYIDKIKILEFGAGEGTRSLAFLLDKKGIDYVYYTFENNPSYKINTAKIKTIIWNKFPVDTGHGIYDLIIIDGPEGVNRAKWYPLIKKNIRPGTIIVIDDFGHYQEFADALNANFDYDIIAQINPKQRTGSTWLIART